MPGKLAVRNIFLFGLGIFNAVLVVTMLVLSGMMLIAADIFMTFIIVFAFWAMLLYVLMGEFPIRLPRKIPESPGIPVRNK